MYLYLRHSVNGGICMQDSYFYKKVKAYTHIILFYLETYLAATNQNSVVIDMLDGMQDEIEKNCIILLLYQLYYKLSDKKSIRYYAKNTIDCNDDSFSKLADELGGLDNQKIKYKDRIERDDRLYDESLYTYKTLRKEKDAYFSHRLTNFTDLYKNFDEPQKDGRLKKLNGQELSYLHFLQMLFIKKYSIFKIMRCSKFYDNKNLSHAEFEDIYFPQVVSKNRGVYYDAISSTRCQSAGAFICAINLFSIEINCHFERNYLMAKAVSLLNKSDKAKEIDTFIHLNCFHDGSGHYQDYMALGYNKIFAQYDYPNVDARDVYDTVHLCNYIMRNVNYNILADIKKENIDIKKLYDEEVDVLNDFLDNTIGQGQHIVEKNIEDIKIRDFRALYKPI